MLSIIAKNQDNIYSLGATICRALSRFILVFLASYILTKYEFGIFNIFLSIYFFSRLFSENSLNLPFIKFSTDGSHPVSVVNFQIILLKITYVAIVSFSLLLFAEGIVVYTGLQRKELIYLLPFVLLSLTAYMYFGQALIAKLKMRPLFIYEICNCFIFAVTLVICYFWIHEFTTEKLIIIFSVSMCLTSLLGLVLFSKHIDPPQFVLNKSLLFKIVNYSKFTILSGISSLVILKADVLMLGYFHSPRLVAVYGIALFVNEAVNIIFDSILRLCLPKASALSGAGQTQQIRRLFLHSVKNIYIGIFPIIVCIGLLAPWVIHQLYNGRYDDSLVIIYIFLFSSLTKPAGYVAGVILGATGKIKYDNRNCWLAAALNVICNLLLIPRYGVMGAAVASTLSFIFLTISNYLSFKNQVLTTDNNSITITEDNT